MFGAFYLQLFGSHLRLLVTPSPSSGSPCFHSVFWWTQRLWHSHSQLSPPFTLSPPFSPHPVSDNTPSRDSGFESIRVGESEPTVQGQGWPTCQSACHSPSSLILAVPLIGSATLSTSILSVASVFCLFFNYIVLKILIQGEDSNCLTQALDSYCLWLELEKAMATHSSTLAWQIPWEELGRLQSTGSLRVGHDWATSLSLFTFHFHALEKEMATHSSVLAWRIPGTGELGGLPSMGSHRVRHDWCNLAAAAAAAAWIQRKRKRRRKEYCFH